VVSPSFKASFSAKVSLPLVNLRPLFPSIMTLISDPVYFCASILGRITVLMSFAVTSADTVVVPVKFLIPVNVR